MGERAALLCTQNAGSPYDVNLSKISAPSFYGPQETYGFVSQEQNLFSPIHEWLDNNYSSDRKKYSVSKIPTPRHMNPVYISRFTSVDLVEATAFFDLMADPKVKRLLEYDICRKVADKYLLAMVFIYFKRCHLRPSEYTSDNFFLALFLAHDMEEDLEWWKEEIYPHALGRRWKYNRLSFLIKRDKLWRKMRHQGVVSRRSCEAVINTIRPDHPIWQRERPIYHTGALRNHQRPDFELQPIGDVPVVQYCQNCVPYF